MSKAFTKEDDEGGFELPPVTRGLPSPFRITWTGAKRAGATALVNAEILAQVIAPERAALGVTVRVRAEDGSVRPYRLVTAEEYVLLGDGVSVHSPLGHALLGATVGDVREFVAPRGNQELEVLSLEGEG